MASIIAVKHNIEVAHRLSLLPGKCEAIHGHSMWVTLTMEGELDGNGILEGINFSDVKKVFRDHLDTQYDHRLLLNQDDPWAQLVVQDTPDDIPAMLPGLNVTPGDPTTENIAKWIGQAMRDNWNYPVIAVEVWETSVNMAREEWPRP